MVQVSEQTWNLIWRSNDLQLICWNLLWTERNSLRRTSSWLGWPRRRRQTRTRLAVEVPGDGEERNSVRLCSEGSCAFSLVLFCLWRWWGPAEAAATSSASIQLGRGEDDVRIVEAKRGVVDVGCCSLQRRRGAAGLGVVDGGSGGGKSRRFPVSVGIDEKPWRPRRTPASNFGGLAAWNLGFLRAKIEVKQRYL
jgi:hypothetical protein